MIQPNTEHLDSKILKKRMEEDILSELLPYRQWVVWRYQEATGRDGTKKWKKPPYDPKTSMAAKTTESDTWGTFQEALRALTTGKFHGIGFVFSETDPFTGTDLDHCVNEDGTIEPWAIVCIKSLDSYCEFSPSKKGVHILTKAKLPGPGVKSGHIEMYDKERYFTITADHVPGTPIMVNDRAVVQSALYRKISVRETPGYNDNTGGGATRPSGLSDAEVLAKARNARNAARFTRLWEGSSEGYSSKSDADFALVLLLLYWTDDDPAQTDRLFRQSKRMDEKWNQPSGRYTYGQLTIHNARKKRRL